MAKRYSKDWRLNVSKGLQTYHNNNPVSIKTREKLSDAGKKGNRIRVYKRLPFSKVGWPSKKRILLEERGKKCEQCGWAEKRKDGNIPVEVDCIDGNHNNPNKKNYKILCPNCHSLTKNYMFYGRKHNALVV